MQRYLADCHQRGVLLEMLPSLVDSPWCALAIDVSGLSLEDIPDTAYRIMMSRRRSYLRKRRKNSKRAMISRRWPRELKTKQRQLADRSIGVRFSPNCRAGLCGHDYSLRQRILFGSRGRTTPTNMGNDSGGRETMVRAGYGMGGPATSGRVSLKKLIKGRYLPRKECINMADDEKLGEEEDLTLPSQKALITAHRCRLAPPPMRSLS